MWRQQPRSRETPFVQQLREWYAGRGRSGGAGPCTYVLRSDTRSGEVCGLPHTTQRCFGRLTDAWRAQFPDAVELPRWHDLLLQNVPIFDLDFDVILAAIYALADITEGDCYLCVLPDPGTAATALGASEAAALGASAAAVLGASASAAPGTCTSAAPGASTSPLSGNAPTESLHTFTLDSGASRSFFRDSTTLTLLSRPVAVSLADPSGGPVLAHSSTVLPCPAAPSGLLSGLHLPSFSTNLVSGADLQDTWVDQFTPGGQRVTHCTCSRTGRHLATFTRRPGSSLYTLTTAPPPASASGQVAASSQVFAAASRSSHAYAPCSCHPLAHETLLWHHRLGHPSLPGLRGMASRALGHERYILLFVDDYSRYTTVFPLRSKGEVPEVLIDWIHSARRQLSESFGSDLLVLRLHSDRGGEFSSDLLRSFCRSEGIRQTFTLPASPQQNGIAERRIGMVMDVARTSMIHAAAPHFLWPFAVQYAAHQINLQPRVSFPETTPTLRWTGKVGDASAFRVWGSRAFVRDTTADKLFSCAVPCVFLGFPPDAPEWQFYHPTSRRVLSSQDVTFDESGSAPSGVSQVDPAEPVEVAVDSGVARGADPAGAGTGGAEIGGAESGGDETGGAESGGAETGRAEPGGVAPEGTVSGGAEPARAESGGALGVPSRREPVSPQRFREWYSRRCRVAAGADAGTTGAPGGAAAAGAAGGAAGAGAAGGAAGAEAAEVLEVLLEPLEVLALLEVVLVLELLEVLLELETLGLRVPVLSLLFLDALRGRGRTTFRSFSSRPIRYLVLLLTLDWLEVLRSVVSLSLVLYRLCLVLRRLSILFALVVFRVRVFLLSQALTMTLRPSTAPQHVPLPSPPASSLPDGPDPESDSLRAASPTVPRFLATAVTDPLFESTTASALVTKLVNFAAACRLDYATSLVAASASTSFYPPSVGGESALGTDVLEDTQEEFESFATSVPHLLSMLLAPEGDPDALDIPTPRSYAEAIEGPYSSQWQAAMDAEMASWKSTGTYVDEVLPPGANIVSGMWIFRVKRPPGSPPAFKARYVARGFSQRQGVDFFQNFSPTPKMTTLRVLLHVAAQRDYELHSLDFSTAFLQGSLHEEIRLRRPPGFTWSFLAGTHWSLRRPVYGLRQAPREWHDTLRTTLASLSFAPSTTDPSLVLRTDTTLPMFYVLVYIDDLVFATADTEALAHVKSELQKRHTCTDLAPPSNESVEPSGPYPELVGCLITSGMGLVIGGRSRVVLTGHADASWVDDLATQRSSQGYTFSLGSGSVSWWSTRSSSVLSSSCEAEIYAGAMAAQELRWLTCLLTDLVEAPRSPPVLYVYNKAMLALCQEHRLEHRTKHISLCYFLARELQQRGQLRLAYLASQANTADVFTKALQPCDHQRFCTALGFVPTVPHLLSS
ncbi:unnamed protein product [Closterium sp. NIES-54]